MRLLALEANLRKLKKQFIAEGEEELLSTTKHAFAFLVPMLWIVPAAVFSVGAWAMGILAGYDMLVLTPLLYAWLAVLGVLAAKAYIDWRYNVVVVTTEKIVVIKHNFVYSETVKPYNLEGVGSASAGTRYFGIGNCGYVELGLSSVKQGTNVKERLECLPKPSVVAGAIENARVLKSQRSPADKGPEAQEQKVEDVQEKTEAELPDAAAPSQG